MRILFFFMPKRSTDCWGRGVFITTLAGFQKFSRKCQREGKSQLLSYAK